MRIALISDIHANLPALEAVLQDVASQRCDVIRFLGDAVGYGPWPAETISMLMEQDVVGVAGNHDTGVVGSSSLADYYDSARFVIEWTREQISSRQFDWLASLPYTRKEDGMLLSHGSPDCPYEFFYISTAADVEELCASSVVLPRVTFVGHSHLHKLFLITGSGRTLELGVDDRSGIEIVDNARYLCVAGSVGQPRDGDPRAAWTLYDTDEKRLFFRRVDYDIKKVQTEIVAHGLPRHFGVRLEEGY